VGGDVTTPAPASRKPVNNALQNVTLAIIGALVQGASTEEINAAIVQGERISRRRELVR
jgi:UDP-N-acetylmuramyl pentapeptide synthase